MAGMNLQQVGTIYSAITATAALLWNILRDRRAEAKKLTIEANMVCLIPKVDGVEKALYFKMVAGPGIPELPDVERVFRIRCTNVGRRPITLTGWQLISQPTAAQPERISIGFFPTALIEESQSYWFEIKDFNLLSCPRRRSRKASY
jgi:hypothetical protein